MYDKRYRLETPNGDYIDFTVTCHQHGCRVWVEASLSAASAVELFGQADVQPEIHITASYFVRSTLLFGEEFVKTEWLIVTLDGLSLPQCGTKQRIIDRITGFVTIYMKPSRLRALRNAIALGSHYEKEEIIHA